jgi:hypothetical protein
LSQGTVKRYLSDGVHRMEDVLGLLPQSRAELDGEDLAVEVRRTR